MNESVDSKIRILSSREIVLNKEKNLKVVKAVPTKVDNNGSLNPPGTEMIFIPQIPHVFDVNELTVSDKNHESVVIKDVNVLMAHGHRVNNKWRFVNGGDVVETVNAYNQYVDKLGQKPIEFLVVCNLQQPSKFNIRVGEFDARQNIAYAVGENVHLYLSGLSKVENGKVTMEVSVDQTFFGLDKLIQSKSEQTNIRIIINNI